MQAEELISEWPAERWRDRKLLVAVSGGADSVALLLALHALATPDQLVAAHLNHNWRGPESAADAAFVVELCRQLNRPCLTSMLQDRDSIELNQTDAVECREAAMLAKARTRSEESARRARYDFLRDAAYEVGASYVVTGHTADDRIETLLHNLLRGSGLAGATSLVMFRPFDKDLVLVRPLLTKRRSDIESFLREQGQEFRTDSSNQWTRYRRNFLRREILPRLAQHYPAADNSLLQFSELAEELSADLETLADRWREQVGQELTTAGEAWRAARQRWPYPRYFLAAQQTMAAMPWSVVHFALRGEWFERQWPLGDMSRSHWVALRELSRQTEGTLNLPGNLRATADQGWLAIGPAGP